MNRNELSILTTDNARKIDIAVNMLKYPHKYFTKERNLSLVKEVLIDVDSIEEIIDYLSLLQTKLSAKKLSKNSIKPSQMKSIQKIKDIKTYPNPCFNADYKKDLAYEELVNNRLIDEYVEALGRIGFLNANSKPCENWSRELIASIWLSNILALILIDLAKVEHNGNNCFFVSPQNTEKSEALRNLWFGVALE